MSESDDEGAFQSADEGDHEKVDASRKITKDMEKTNISKPAKPERPKPPPKPAARGSPSGSPKPMPRAARKPVVEEKSEVTLQNDSKVSADAAPQSSADTNIIKQQPATEPPQDAIISRSAGDGAEEANPEQKHHSVLEKLTEAAESHKPASWGTWGSWGSSMLTSATSSVTTFTSQVGEGFNTVLETVEHSLGTPTPEELAQQTKAAKVKEPSEFPNGQSECSQEDDPEGEWQEKKHLSSDEESEKKDAEGGEKQAVDSGVSDGASASPSASGSWFASIGAAASGIGAAASGLGTAASGFGTAGASSLTGITKSVQATSKNLMTGGLDVLETIGKKTYNVLAEGDHGLKNTIKKTAEKPNLSRLLRDAKDHFETHRNPEEEHESGQAHFGYLFDEHNGLVHLEALELVSSQSQGKYRTLLGTTPQEKHQTIDKEMTVIEEAFHIDDEERDIDEVQDHSFGQLILTEMNCLNLPVTTDHLVTTQDKARSWIKDCQEEQQSGVRTVPLEIHRAAIASLAELTAVSIQQFHKVAQLFQMGPTEPITVYKEKARNLATLTKVLGAEVDIVASKFNACLNKAAENSEEPDSVNPLITNVYLEATNSKTYIHDAFQLLLPVVQHTALMVSHTEDLYS